MYQLNRIERLETDLHLSTEFPQKYQSILIRKGWTDICKKLTLLSHTKCKH